MSETVGWNDEPPEPEPYVPSVFDADVAPDDVAAWAVTVTPGSAVVTPLAVLDPRRMSHEGRVDALAALERQLSWLQARQHRFLAVMAQDPVVPTVIGELDKQWVREDVACALRLSSSHAADRLELATALTARLPATLELQEAGEISGHHSRHLAEATSCLDDAATATVENSVLPKAPGQSLASFRRAVNRSVLAAAPQSAEQRLVATRWARTSRGAHSAQSVRPVSKSSSLSDSIVARKATRSVHNSFTPSRFTPLPPRT